MLEQLPELHDFGGDEYKGNASEKNNMTLGFYMLTSTAIQ